MTRLRTLPSKGPRPKPSWGTGSGKALAKASARASGKALGAGSDRHDPCNNRVALGARMSWKEQEAPSAFICNKKGFGRTAKTRSGFHLSYSFIMIKPLEFFNEQLFPKIGYPNSCGRALKTMDFGY